VARKRIGEILVAAGAVKAAAVEQALVQQGIEGGLLGEILQKTHACNEDDVLRALGAQLGMQFLADFPLADIDPELAAQVPIGFAKQHRILPLRREGDAVLMATADPLDVGALDDVRGMLATEVVPVLMPGGKLLDAVNQVYGRNQDAGSLGKGEGGEDEGAAEELVDLLDVNDEAPIIRWVNALMFNAVKERASDIHIEPGEKDVTVRYRIDGVLYETRRAPRQFIPSIISRVKIMAGLNIAEKRLYYFPSSGEVATYAISIGREGWDTPLGHFYIESKVKDPTWTPPASIRAEHAAQGDILPAVVPGKSGDRIFDHRT